MNCWLWFGFTLGVLCGASIAEGQIVDETWEPEEVGLSSAVRDTANAEATVSAPPVSIGCNGCACDRPGSKCGCEGCTCTPSNVRSANVPAQQTYTTVSRTTATVQPTLQCGPSG